LELLEKTHVGTPESVDGLVGIADGAEAGTAVGEEPHELVLALVHVLVFVDGEMGPAVAVMGGEFGPGGEQLDGQSDEVVEIDEAAFPHRLG